MMDIIVVGLNHKTAPIEIREKLAFSDKALKESLTRLRQIEGIRENLILSTCNRVEIYSVAHSAEDGINTVKEFLAAYQQIEKAYLEQYLYAYDGDEAVSHIFRVASSLDSMVIGEPQILGQMKQAYKIACDCKTAHFLLHALMRKAFKVAKTIRTETGISRSAVSISFAAVELAKKIFGRLSDKQVLIIGAGEMGELAIRHLISEGVQKVFVANRTYERAIELAKAFQGTAVAFDHIRDALITTDIIISSTGSPHYLLKYEDIRTLLPLRKNRPMFLIDIAVPRNLDPDINQLDNVYLYDIDDLQAVVEANIKERAKEAQQAEEIVGQEVHQFSRWLKAQDAVPTIKALRKKVEAISKGELEKRLPELKNLSEKDLKKIQTMVNLITNKILHDPLVTLKKLSDTEEGSIYIQATQKLFGLETDVEYLSDRGAASANAVLILKTDHEKVKQLLREYKVTVNHIHQKSLAEKIFKVLEIHTRLEEEIFYPAIQAKMDHEGRQLVTENIREHKMVDTLIKELRILNLEDAQYEPKFKAFAEIIEDHIEEEEEEMFFGAEEKLGEMVERLGIEMERRKEELITSVN
jgi:glutamyl-tRNA reductase